MPAASRGGSPPPSSRPARVAAVAELQAEERLAVVLADLVELHDVRVRTGGATASASIWKRIALGGAGLGAGEDHLQRDDPAQRQVAGLLYTMPIAPRPSTWSTS